ncbi:hypothetical protein SLEP1_g60094 [Rubroshorea leprosula]|uniref:Uncharacterized protein n=1 Tax=Rubroshorea leprosula TaxID=152421 RepID=A0AAV5MUR9_9ROSI|nr:hypothetical protein SLEP1_g60094 [Rubroshorea leprosula]
MQQHFDHIEPSHVVRESKMYADQIAQMGGSIFDPFVICEDCPSSVAYFCMDDAYRIFFVRPPDVAFLVS